MHAYTQNQNGRKVCKRKKLRLSSVITGTSTVSIKCNPQYPCDSKNEPNLTSQYTYILKMNKERSTSVTVKPTK